MKRAKTFREYAEERFNPAKIAALDAAVEAEIERMHLRDVRKALEMTQAELARTLGVNQPTVSKIERETDMLLSTLRGFIEGMGGTLRVIAEFEDGGWCEIGQFADAARPRSAASRKRESRAVVKG